jgi:ABC-2 type transport system ATP-binding protein
VILEASNISKSFGGKFILQNISFTINQNETVGLIGPNGSGKTTLLNILLRTFKPNSGNFYIKDKVKIGMSVSRKGFFGDMTVKDNLIMYAQLQNIPEEKVNQVMQEFMIDFGDKQFNNLSAGMKQRVSLVMPFLNDNNLILLDEPYNHLDIDSIFILRNKIVELRNKGVSFLITSHILADMEKICDRVLFLKTGKLHADISTKELMESYGSLDNAYLKLTSQSI